MTEEKPEGLYHKEIIDIPKPWYLKRGIIELLPIRKDFFTFHGELAKCTCDTCIDVTRCSLAYDAYNTEGDCLLSK